MKHSFRNLLLLIPAVLAAFCYAAAQQRPPGGPDGGQRPPGGNEFGPPGFRQPAFGPPGMGGPGGMMGQERQLVAQFDEDDNGWLNSAERAAARKFLSSDEGGRRPGFGPPGRRGGGREEAVSPGESIAPADVATTDAPLYDPNVVRTIFLDFENEDWEAELEAFNNTDVEVPATLSADGRTYENVGVHFRGMSSFGMVSAGHKRSLNVSMDFLNDDQKLHGYKTLNLLNAHEDPSFLRTVLYLDIARQHIPAPKANFVRVVINGSSWGLYVNAQQFNKEFIKENFPTTKGTRWKVPGSPMGRGGLEYLGEDISAYERIYEMKTDDGEKAWKRLIELCRVLNETPTEQLEAALGPLLDIEGALWFLALENALVNADGYWTRASDYNIFLDADGRFHIIPHDANETFHAGMGPGMGRGGFGPGPGGLGPGPGGFGGPGAFGPGPGGFGPGPGGFGPGPGPRGEDAPLRDRDRGREGRERDRDGGRFDGRDRERRGPGGGGPGGRPGGMNGGVTLDPLVGLDDPSKPLRSRLLAVPALRQRYVSMIRTIAEQHLDWSTLGPQVSTYAGLIGPYVEADTRKLSSWDDFQNAVSDTASNAVRDERDERPGFGPGGRRPQVTLKQFADQRREFLLKHPEVAAARAE